MTSCDGALVGSYSLELPDVFVLFIILDEADDVIVSHYLFEGVIVDGADKLDSIWVILKVIFVVLYCPYNSGTEALSIFLWWCQEGTSYEFCWVDVFELGLTDTITFDRFYECF
jgi:hypothetical protein